MTLIETPNLGTFIPLPAGVAGWIRKAFKFVSFQEDEKRVALKGVCIDWSGVTASDGRCLVHFPFEESVDLTRRLTLMENNLKTSTKTPLYINHDGTCDVLVSKHECGWKCLSGHMRSDYPDWTRICPHDYLEKIEFGNEKRKELIQALKSAPEDCVGISFTRTQVSFDNYKEPPFNFNYEKICNLMVINAPHDHDFIQGWETKIMFAADYLLELLTEMKPTTLEYIDGNSPVRFTGGDGWALLMPKKWY